MRAIALTTLLLTLGTAQADGLVVTGNPDASECYRATMLPDMAAEAAITSCNIALNTRRIGRRQRASVLVNRGILYNHIGEYTAAVEDFEKALSLISDFPEAYINRGNTYYYTGQVERAIADYDRAIRLKPEGDYAYQSLAWLLATVPDERYRDGARAVRLAKRAVALDPDESYNHMALAAAYSEVGQFDDAVAAQARALDMARAEGHPDVIAEFQKYLDFYRNGRPYRE